MATENLKIGARGWRHQQWHGSYYPDDLPDDWRLAYYANDFEVVLVPPEYWVQSKGYDLEEWSSVSEGFRFYLECPLLEDVEAIRCFQDQCADIGDSLGGVLITDDSGVNGLELHCPVVHAPAFSVDGLCLGVMSKEFDDLRKSRAWLEAFDRGCIAEQKVVFVTNGSKDDVQMETVKRIQTLSELMAL